MTLDESAINDLSAPNDDDDDIEMKDSEVVIKEEKPEVAGDNLAQAEDDDDVMIMPQEEPVVTEILDEAEHPRSDLNVTDDDVMIQEPKIETQLVDDDDDDDYLPATTSDEAATGLIVKIKEEPKDDGYEDLVNEEDDAFVEVTAIANDDLIGESLMNAKLLRQTNTKFTLFHDSQTTLTPTRPKLHSNQRKTKTRCLMIHRC